MTVVDITLITQDDLNTLEAVRDDIWVEVVHGEIVQVARDMTYLHLVIIENLYDNLKLFVRAKKLGRVHTDGLRYILIGGRRGMQLARKPDFSFIRAERFPADFDPSGDFEGAPDLAVEVVSPGQTSSLILGRVSEYLTYGTEEVWVIYPSRREVWSYRADSDTPTAYREGETLTSPLFPDWSMPVELLFVIED